MSPGDSEPGSDSESDIDESAAQAEALHRWEERQGKKERERKERKERKKERRIEAIIHGMEGESASKKCPPTLVSYPEVLKKARTGDCASHKQSDLVTSGTSLLRLLGFC